MARCHASILTDPENDKCAQGLYCIFGIEIEDEEVAISEGVVIGQQSGVIAARVLVPVMQI